METQRVLLSQITSLDTLRAAWLHIRSKGAAGGTDGMSVGEFGRDFDAHLDELRRDLIEERYVPQPFQQIAVPKRPGSSETRILRLPSVRDKIAQEAVRSVLEPMLDRLFLDCSYGYRAGRGASRAISRVTHCLRYLRHRWVATADIDNFFGSIDHDLLLDRLRAVIREEAVLRLVHLWLRMGAVDGQGRWQDVYSGVGQGGVISPLLANFYLHPFDEHMVAAGFGLVRYADDFVICAAERSQAEDALVKATAYLDRPLGLRLNANPRPIASAEEGFDFLGIAFVGDRRLIEAAKLGKIRAKTRAISNWDPPANALRALNEAVAGWQRYYARVVEPADLADADAAVTDALARVIARALQSRRWRVHEARAAITHQESLLPRGGDARKAWLDGVVGNALARNRPHAGQTQPSSPTPQPPRATDPDQTTVPSNGQASDTGACHDAAPAVDPCAPTSGEVPGGQGSSAEKAGPTEPTNTNVPLATAIPKTPGASPSTDPGRAAEPRPLDPRGDSQTRATAAARAPQSPAAAVRRTKRRHLRSLAQVSELVLNTPGCFVGKAHQRVVVRQDRRTVCEVPSARLTAITVASRGISLSADVIDHCAENDIPLLFLSPAGKPLAVLSAPESSRGAVGLLQLQALADGPRTLDLARRFVEGKLRNQMALLKYFQKYRKRVDAAFADACPRALKAMEALLSSARELRFAGDYEAVRGHLFSIEGRAASHYWEIVTHLLRGRAEFPGRQRRGATDLVNSLLNYGYGILQSRVHLAVLQAGLVPQVSFLHALQKGDAPTLVFDLMEEFRPQVVDRTVLTLLARREKVEVGADGFLTDGTRRRVIAQVHDRLATLVRFRGKELKLDEIIRHQAQALVRHLRGEGRYRPFAAKW